MTRGVLMGRIQPVRVFDEEAERLEAAGLWRRASSRWLAVMMRRGLTHGQREWLCRRRECLACRLCPDERRCGTCPARVVYVAGPGHPGRRRRDATPDDAIPVAGHNGPPVRRG